MNTLPKLWISPLNLDIINISKIYDIGYIISENQVSHDKSGYTSFTVESLRKLLPNKQIWRDHSSCNNDLLEKDIKFLNGIHLDVFKSFPNKSIEEYAEEISRKIKFCCDINPNIMFEIGTEEAIFKYEFDYLAKLFNLIQKQLKPSFFNQIKFAVIQCGTKIINGQNENHGEFDSKRLIKFYTFCELNNIKPKEHNTDYIKNHYLSEKVELIDKNLYINIAPEVGSIISSKIYENSSTDNKEKFFKLVIKNNNLQKWLNKPLSQFLKDEEDENKAKLKIVKIGGHYVFNNPDFFEIYKDTYNKGLNDLDYYLMTKNKILY